MTRYAYSVTIGEGYTTRISAQTASRDYTADVVPGEYPIRFTDINYRDVAPEDSYYALVPVVIVSPERRESTVEVAGVAYGWCVQPETVEDYTMIWYSYEVKRDSRRVETMGEFLTFNFEEED